MRFIMNPEQTFFETLAWDTTCFIDDDINPSTLRIVTKTLVYAKIKKMPFTVYIKSSGGDVLTSLKIYSAIKAHPYPTKGIIIGEANSAAATVLQACDKRLVHRYNNIHLHAINSYRSVYTEKDVEGMKYQVIVENILSKTTLLSLKEVKSIMKNIGGKRFFDKEILDVGLADKFIKE